MIARIDHDGSIEGFYVRNDVHAPPQRKGLTHMNGTIKRIKTEGGFGFILGEDKKEYFFHRSAVKNARFEELNEGDAVTFEESEGQKGPRAEDVYL